MTTPSSLPPVAAVTASLRQLWHAGPFAIELTEEDEAAAIAAGNLGTHYRGLVDRPQDGVSKVICLGTCCNRATAEVPR